MRLLQKQRCQDHGEPDCEIPNFRFMCNQTILLNSSENTAQAQFRDTFMAHNLSICFSCTLLSLFTYVKLLLIERWN